METSKLVMRLSACLVLLGFYALMKYCTSQPGLVAVRSNVALRLLNAALIIPCFLVDRFGYKVPKVGYMLEQPLSLKKLMKAAERRTGLSDWGEGARPRGD